MGECCNGFAKLTRLSDDILGVLDSTDDEYESSDSEVGGSAGWKSNGGRLHAGIARARDTVFGRSSRDKRGHEGCCVVLDNGDDEVRLGLSIGSILIRPPYRDSLTRDKWLSDGFRRAF
jgi:hypothetical protein